MHFEKPENYTIRKPAMDINPVIGSGFDVSRGSFQGDSHGSYVSADAAGNDHPFYNVDHNTMMVCLNECIILKFMIPGYEESFSSTSKG
jgi:hypothetical protein